MAGSGDTGGLGGNENNRNLELISQIGRELQDRFTFMEIDGFLSEFRIDPPEGDFKNSKWVYTKAALRGIETETVIKIAVELDIPVPSISKAISNPPKNWETETDFKLFISHISADKDKAKRLKESLASYAISGFVAHEDIHPTLEWQVEIERALHSMNAFVAIHTAGFSNSFWTQQEIGFAVGKDIKIISLKMGEDPTGFISKQQALARRNKTAEEVAREIDQLLSEDERTTERLRKAKVERGIISPFDEEIPF